MENNIATIGKKGTENRSPVKGQFRGDGGRDAMSQGAITVKAVKRQICQCIRPADGKSNERNNEMCLQKKNRRRGRRQTKPPSKKRVRKVQESDDPKLALPRVEPERERRGELRSVYRGGGKGESLRHTKVSRKI